jgi:hypothetical protein
MNLPAYENLSKWTIADLDLEVLPARRRDEPDALLRVSAFIDGKIYDSEKIWKNGKRRRDEIVGEFLSRGEYVKLVGANGGGE